MEGEPSNQDDQESFVWHQAVVPGVPQPVVAAPLVVPTEDESGGGADTASAEPEDIWGTLGPPPEATLETIKGGLSSDPEPIGQDDLPPSDGAGLDSPTLRREDLQAELTGSAAHDRLPEGGQTTESPVGQPAGSTEPAGAALSDSGEKGTPPVAEPEIERTRKRPGSTSRPTAEPRGALAGEPPAVSSATEVVPPGSDVPSRQNLDRGDVLRPASAGAAVDSTTVSAPAESSPPPDPIGENRAIPADVLAEGVVGLSETTVRRGAPSASPDDITPPTQTRGRDDRAPQGRPLPKAPRPERAAPVTASSGAAARQAAPPKSFPEVLASKEGSTSGRRRPLPIVAGVAALLLVAVVVPLALLGSGHARSTGGTKTGGTAATTTAPRTTVASTTTAAKGAAGGHHKTKSATKPKSGHSSASTTTTTAALSTVPATVPGTTTGTSPVTTTPVSTVPSHPTTTSGAGTTTTIPNAPPH